MSLGVNHRCAHCGELTPELFCEACIQKTEERRKQAEQIPLIVITVGSFCPMIDAICGMSCADSVFGKPCTLKEKYWAK